MTKLSSSWCTAFELYHIVRSSYTVHQRPQNEMWSLLDMFTLMFVESFALFIIKTNKPTKTNNECYSKNKSMFCLILTEGRLFSLVSLLDGYNETRKVYRCSRTDAQFKEVKKLVVVGEGWKWLLECLTKNDLAKKHNNSFMLVISIIYAASSTKTSYPFIPPKITCMTTQTSNTSK